MSKKYNNAVFIILRIVAWIIFIGLCVEAGGLLVNFIISLFKPEIISNLYKKLDLSELYKLNKWGYYSMYSFILIISILKAYIFYVVIRLVTKLDLSKPFNNFVSKQISQISYFTFSIGLLSYLARESSKFLYNKGFEIDVLNQFWVDSEAFILMAAVIYVIATIFKRGIEIQTENDLTV